MLVTVLARQSSHDHGAMVPGGTVEHRKVFVHAGNWCSSQRNTRVPFAFAVLVIPLPLLEECFDPHTLPNPPDGPERQVDASVQELGEALLLDLLEGWRGGVHEEEKDWRRAVFCRRLFGRGNNSLETYDRTQECSRRDAG